MSKKEFKPGDIVQSSYSARWYGRVVSNQTGWVDKYGRTIEPDYVTIDGKYLGPRHPVNHNRPIFHCPEGCCLVFVAVDKSGRPHRKPFFATLHSHYLRKVEPKEDDVLQKICSHLILAHLCQK